MHIGIWGQRHLNYLRENKRVLLTRLHLSGKLRGYLEDIDQQAAKMYEMLVKQMAEHEDVTEQLKELDQMKWVVRMNNILKRATEIVNTNLFYSGRIEVTVKFFLVLEKPLFISSRKWVCQEKCVSFLKVR